MDYTAERLEQLESETVGELAKGTTTIVGGWSKTVYPSGRIVAKAELDYVAGTDFTWTEITTAYFQENLPNGLLTEIHSCDAICTDISPNAAYTNSMEPSFKEMFGTGVTTKYCFKPTEHIWGDPNYAAPTKLHIAWTVEGV